jgi:shikimate 5-dehydrogenase
MSLDRRAVPPEGERIPVMWSASALREFLPSLPKGAVCALFFANRGTAASWSRSITRVSLNLVDPRFFYVPVETGADGLADIYEVAREFPSVVGLNHTTPHKNNVHLRSLLGLSPEDERIVDFALRSHQGFSVMELNGPSFMRWITGVCTDEELSRAQFVVRGAGNSGLTILQHIAQAFPEARIVAVDLSPDRRALAQRCVPSALVVESLSAIDSEEFRSAVVIDATGSDDSLHLARMQTFLTSIDPPGVFVDLRTATHDPATPWAASHGWKAFDGGGMSVTNDWAMVSACMAATGYTLEMGFEAFREMSEQVTAGLLGAG